MRRAYLLSFAFLSFLSLSGAAVYAQNGSRFVWGQLQYPGGWDPYPAAWPEIADYLKGTTSIPFQPDRHAVTATDPALFELPFMVLTGKDAPPELSEPEVAALRRYLFNGGFLWIDDASGLQASPFDRWVRKQMTRLLPDSSFEVLSSTHAVFRSFYLLRSIGGRVQVRPFLEGLVLQNRTVVLYTRNDLEGTWMKDSLGNYLYPCVPGGESQRLEARKLTVNVILYALTGSYKLDAVHQPFILEKLRSYAQ
jgi:hypothetical protein